MNDHNNSSDQEKTIPKSSKDDQKKSSQDLAKQRNTIPDFEKLCSENPDYKDYEVTFDF